MDDSIETVALRHAEADVIDLREMLRKRIADGQDIVIDLRRTDADVHVEIDLRPTAAEDVSETGEHPAAPVAHRSEPLAGDVEDRVRALGGLVAASRPQLMAKRALDLAVAVTTLILLSPLMVAVALIVTLSSPGPALYRSTRVGKNGEEFTFLKFRSMYADADARKASLGDLNEQEGPVFKLRNDPRVTPLGRLLRRTSVDELPQLFHVVSGRMSLVGPRPALPDEVAEYDERQRLRLSVQPGVTCIWQVSGRSNVDFDTWVDMDLEYIEQWSVASDVGLLFRTVPAVLSGDGAY